MIFPLGGYERNVYPEQCTLRGRHPIHQFPVSDGQKQIKYEQEYEQYMRRKGMRCVRPMHSSHMIPSYRKWWVLWNKKNCYNALGKKKSWTKNKTHIITFWPTFHLSSSTPVPRLAMVPEILPKRDEYIVTMIQRRFTRGQESREVFLLSIDLGQYWLGNRERPLKTGVNHSHKLWRNKRLGNGFKYQATYCRS